MKPWQIGLLVAVGAVGGAVVMKVTQSSAPAPAVVASAPAAAAPAVSAPEPAIVSDPAPATPPAAEPAPARARRQTATSRPAQTASIRQPSQTAAPSVTPAPPPVVTTPPPVTTPAPRAEPEAVTPPPPPPPPPPAPKPEPARVTLSAGTALQVRTTEALTSDRNMPGDQFTGVLDAPLTVDGFVIAERGARVEGRVVASDKGGKVKGVSSIAVELTRLNTSDGQRIAIATESFTRQGETSKKADAAKIGAGAAIGAAIGAIAGGGKGAGIGAGVGGGAGAGDVLLTRGKPATISSETRLTFRLRDSVTITERQR